MFLGARGLSQVGPCGGQVLVPAVQWYEAMNDRRPLLIFSHVRKNSGAGPGRYLRVQDQRRPQRLPLRRQVRREGTN